MWAYSTAPEIAKIGIFGINLPKRGITPYAMFTKFGFKKGVPGPYLMPNFIIVALKMWVYGPQNVKNCNFWYKFAPKGKFKGQKKKLNTGAQLQTSLYAMTP